MLPTEVGTFGKWLATSPLADDRIWRRDVENIGSTELQLFYARAGFGAFGRVYIIRKHLLKVLINVEKCVNSTPTSLRFFWIVCCKLIAERSTWGISL